MNDHMGKLIDEKAPRDAVHFAIAPVVAGEKLWPGQHIGLDIDGNVTTSATSKIGIVDPFLLDAVQKGQRFYMMLYPDTITDLRHHWTHPAFDDQPPAVADNVVAPAKATPKKRKPTKVSSKKWLREFAERCGFTYGRFMEAVNQLLAGNGPEILGYDTPSELWEEKDEMWVHLRNLEELEIPDDIEDLDWPIPYSCSC